MDPLTSRPGVSFHTAHIDRRTGYRDDLFHDPAYKTRLFEILSVLQALALQIHESNLCLRCRDEISSVIVETSRQWLGNLEENVDFPLDKRHQIWGVTGCIEEEWNEEVPILRIFTALGYNVDLSGDGGERGEVLEMAMKVRSALEERWFRDAVEQFISHVPLPEANEGEYDEVKAEEYRREMQLKLWYLLLGKKFTLRHLRYEYEITTFATHHFDLLKILGSQQRMGGERFCGELNCWSNPEVVFADSLEIGQDSPRLFEYLLGKMVKKIRRVILSALESEQAPRWLKSETDGLFILHCVSELSFVKDQFEMLKVETRQWYLDEQDINDWVFEWSGGYLLRESKEKDLPGVPIGEESVLRQYEGLRMGRIVNSALGILGFGGLGFEDEEQEEEEEGELMDVDESPEDLEMSSSGCCDAGVWPVYEGRYYE